MQSGELASRLRGVIAHDRSALASQIAETTDSLCLPVVLSEVSTALGGLPPRVEGWKNRTRQYGIPAGSSDDGGVFADRLLDFVVDQGSDLGVRVSRVLLSPGLAEVMHVPRGLGVTIEEVRGYTPYRRPAIVLWHSPGEIHCTADIGESSRSRLDLMIAMGGTRVAGVIEFEKRDTS